MSVPTSPAGDTQHLAALLDAVAGGAYPPADGSVTVLPQPAARYAGVLGFTAHLVVFADLDPVWVRAQLPEGDLSAPLNPPFLSLLSSRLNRRVNSIDLLCTAVSKPGPGPVPLAPAHADGHPRVIRARRYRDDVRVWEGAGGLVLLGRGVAGRWEVSVDVPAHRRGLGLGRSLAVAARHLIPDGAHVWAQIAPGNAASVRAFLAAGYEPVGAEALLMTSE